jgi:hypothetical protein
METQMNLESPRYKFSDHFVSFLGGLVVGAVAWAVTFGVVAIIKAASPPGLNLLDIITAVKLVPPPGIDLSNVNLVISLPNSPDFLASAISISFVAVPILIGVVVTYISYKRILKLD